MGKRTEDRILDGSLERVRDEANLMVLCSAEPSTFLEATDTFALASIAMDNGDYVIADGDAGGRKVTIGAQASVTASASGEATHVALVDTVNSRLLAVTICLAQTVTAGILVNFPSWKATILDPT